MEKKRLRTVGILGGLSWHSTAMYYRILNEYVASKFGGLTSAPMIMYSCDLSIARRVVDDQGWAAATDFFGGYARRLQDAGAECLVIATNTVHNIADDLQARLNIPLLHIADAMADEIKFRGMKRVGLLGTKYTMEGGIYVDRMRNHGIETLVPGADLRKKLSEIIYAELACGIVRDESRRIYNEAMMELRSEGAEAAILGCTEIPLLYPEGSPILPTLDSAKVHATAVARWCAGETNAP